MPNGVSRQKSPKWYQVRARRTLSKSARSDAAVARSSLSHVEKIRERIHSHGVKRHGKLMDLPEYRNLQRRRERILNALEKIVQSDSELSSPRARRLDKKDTKASDRIRELEAHHPPRDIHYVRDLAKYSARYALFALGIDPVYQKNAAIQKEVEEMVRVNPWLYQFEAIRPRLVKILGRKRMLEFWEYYYEFYRLFADEGWKLHAGYQ